MAKIILVIGLAQHGTTMVAGILEILGVPMTNRIYVVNSQEDRQAIKASRNRDTFAEFIEKRNQQYDVWGFKRPNMWRHLPMLKLCLPDAILFAIYKDPVSVARRKYGVRPNTVAQVLDEMRDSINEMDKYGVFVNLLSYHKAAVMPEQFVDEIVEIAGLDASDDQRRRAAAFIQPNVDGHKGPYPTVKEWLIGE